MALVDWVQSTIKISWLCFGPFTQMTQNSMQKEDK